MAAARDPETGSSALASLRSTVSDVVGTLTRLVVRLVALTSGLTATMLGLLSRTLSSLGERSADLADVESPVERERRSGRRRAGLWFAGGFLAGASVGVAASELRHRATEHTTVDDATARHLAAVQADVAGS